MTRPGRQRGKSHTIVEVRGAIEALDKGDWKRLMTAARDSLRRYRLDDPARDHEDLLQEAFLRLLAGTRSWRRGVGFEYQLARVMDSIASNWRRRSASSPEIRECELSSPEVGDEDAASPLPDRRSPEPSVEKRVVTAGEAQEVAKLFAHDGAALEVLRCLYMELTRREMRRRTGMSEKQLAAVIRRLRRQAETLRSGK